ncbi:MAG: circadian clock KaiB family protein [Aeromicrobium sp.]
MTAPHDATLRRFEDELAALDETRYELTLFVSGASDLAARAIANARRLCDVHLRGRCDLSVVDVHDDPTAAVTSRLLATPTLVKNLPLPVRRVVGDLSHTDKVLRALDLPAAREKPATAG